MNTPLYDLVSIGETMLRFSPKPPLRLEQSSEMEVHLGGSESNTLVGLSRLGLKTAWISRLPNHAMGQQVARGIAMHGVDTQHIVWSNHDRLGLYFYEPGSGPRTGEVIYDRRDSAFANFQATELPIAPLQSARWFHATGISLALGPQSREMMFAAKKLATTSGAKVSFDFNYRAKLWDMDSAREHTLPWVTDSDLVFFAKRDATAWLQLPTDCENQKVVQTLCELRNGKTTVITLGAAGAIAASSETCVHVPTIRVEDTGQLSVGRLGGGDAFSAGVLYGYLQDWSLEEALRWGNAMAGIKYSIPGDLPVIHRNEVSKYVERLNLAAASGTSTNSLQAGVNR